MEKRTGLLVSVRSATEAEIAVAAGADVIDIKEPRRGALGPADPRVIADVVAMVAGRVPVSAALGELCDLNPARQSAGDKLCPELTWAKLGLAGCAARDGWQAAWQSWVAKLPPEVAAVAVIYADWRAANAPEPTEILELACKLRCRAVLIDTFHKSRGTLVDLMPNAQLGELIAEIRGANMLAVAAGSLNALAIRQILPLFPHFVAVRTAVCEGGREDSIAANRVRSLAQILHGEICATTSTD